MPILLPCLFLRPSPTADGIITESQGVVLRLLGHGITPSGGIVYSQAKVCLMMRKRILHRSLLECLGF